uniref:Ank repeat PF/00023 containing protein, putative n=2 Tax=Oryza sativa subsp. japonica TaxID=39947 RepID=Q53JM2_ORYSJ|nr:ankyrin repeat and SOCS box protein 11 isoform X2 [Oryza sativa Japonica Group]AAX95173.1 hypothetical protein LOC_Os11g14480 [Oryza sativa Japonica Group]ABA92380.1 Ank repeat PF/00023 containing protein, putative [Oryza sativa Japonica Group]
MGHPRLRAGPARPDGWWSFLGGRRSPWAGTARHEVPIGPCRPDGWWAVPGPGRAGRAIYIDRQLLEAAKSGDSTTLKEDMAAREADVLLRTTKNGSNCLHIACIHGHLKFCKDALEINQSSLLAAVNSYGETPLLAAVTSGHTALASELLRCCSESGLGDVILKQDGSGCNALHHAIRCGHKDLALELIAKEPALSRAVNKDNESPMFIAMMRDFADIFEKLLAIPDSSDVGCKGFNALHAAVRSGNAGEIL